MGVGSTAKAAGERIGVRHVETHPSYDADTDEYDMGLVFLSRPTTRNVTLPALNRDPAFPAPGATSRAMGWGDTDEGDGQTVSEELLFVDLNVLSNEVCGKARGGDVSYDTWIFDDMLCTYTQGRDACQGDSGAMRRRPVNMYTWVLVF